MPRGRVQREADKAAGEKTHVEPDHDVTKDENVEAEAPKSRDQKEAVERYETLDKDHRDHLGVDHRQVPQEPELSTEHMTGYDEPEAPQEPEGPAEPPQDVDNRTRDGMQVPVDPPES